MIRTFGDQGTHDLFVEGDVPDQRCGWEDVADVAKRKLDALHAAERLTDLWHPPGNKPKSVEGEWYTIRVNDQWRIEFEWDEHEGCADKVHICDPDD